MSRRGWFVVLGVVFAALVAGGIVWGVIAGGSGDTVASSDASASHPSGTASASTEQGAPQPSTPPVVQPTPAVPTPTPTPTPSQKPAAPPTRSAPTEPVVVAPPLMTPPALRPPVAAADTVTFDLRVDPDHASGALLANDTDPDGRALSAIPTSGSFALDGQSVTAGTYSIAADGTIDLYADADHFGPLPQLAPDQPATVTLPYTITNGVLSSTAAVTVDVTGRLDPYYVVGPIGGVTEHQILDVDAPTATVFDATGVFASPDPLPYAAEAASGAPSFSYVWSATSSGTVPAVPAFTGADVSTVNTVNADWGSQADGTVSLELVASDGRTASTSVDFGMTQHDDPPVVSPDSVPWDLRVDANDASGNVLTNDSDAGGGTLAAVPSSGDFTIDGQTTIAGSYTIAADGALSLTASSDDFGPLPKLAPGQAATVTLSYTATDGIRSAPGTVTVDVTGRLDPYYVVGPIGGIPANGILDSTKTATFDATNTFASPDPVVHAPDAMGSQQRYTLQWLATSNNNVPGVDALMHGTDALSFDAPNIGWGLNSEDHISVGLQTTDGRFVAATADFQVKAPPVAHDDTVAFDLRSDAQHASGEVLGNDTDPYLRPLSVVPISGTFTLAGQSLAAGSYTIDAQGHVSLTAAPDPFGPLPRLADGQTTTATLHYTLDDGQNQVQGTVTVNVTGRSDPFYPVAPLGGIHEGQELDVGACAPTAVDASGAFASPDGGTPVLHWSATSTGTVPAIPAFASGADLPSVSVANAAWGSGSSNSISVYASAPGRPDSAPITVHFTVGDTASPPVTGAPTALADTLDWDLRNTLYETHLDVLTNDTDSAGTPLTAVGAVGTFTLPGQTTVAGTYTVSPDGTMNIAATSDPFGPLPKLAPGEQATVTLPYSVTDGTTIASSTVTVTITGRIDGYYQIRPFMPDVDGQLLDFNSATPTVFDATNLFASPDPGPVNLEWTGTSTAGAPPGSALDDSPFVDNADVETVSLLNRSWGFDSVDTVTVTVNPGDGRALVSTTIHFMVGDGG